MAAVNAAHSDGENQVFSMLGVIGTLGTADTTGTAKTLPIGVNPDTGAMYVDVMDTTFNIGTLTVGTINKIGTVGEVTQGSITVTAGTMSAGTINAGTITSGSITVVAGTVSAGTINSGTITSGSISVVAGTMNAGTLNAGTITAGSITVVAGTVSAGTINAGTITSGSITVVAGTVSAGTINAGTITSGSIIVTNSTIGAGTLRANLIDDYGFKTEYTPMDEMRTIEPFRLVGAQFNGTTLDSNFWTSSLGTGGTASVGNAQLLLYNGVTADNISSVQSVRSGRYVGGASNRYRAVVRLPDTGTNLVTRRWGAFNSTDGAFYQLAGTAGTAFSVVTRKGGTDTPVSNGSLNGNYGATYTLDTNVHTWEIYWTNSKVWFAMGGTLMHTVTAATTTWTNELTLPVRMENFSTGGGTANTSLNVRTATVYRLGAHETDPIYKNSTTAGTTTYKNGAGKLHAVMVNIPTNNAITIYDSVGTSGTTIASLSPGVNTNPFEMHYNTPFYNGLTVVTAGTPNLTFIYE